MPYIFPPPPQPSVAIAHSDSRFAVRRIFCVGRNYAAHAREMGHDPAREPPFFFTKPADAVVDSGSEIHYPPQTADLQHEIELVVAIGADGCRIRTADAPQYVYAYAVGIDLTRRDLQAEAKALRRPWDWAKAFDCSAPCGPVYPVTQVGHPQQARIWLAVNGDLRQDGNIDALMWSVPEVISILSHSMQLKTGDLIYTGTPRGVGALAVGDHLSGGITGLGEIALSIV